MRPGEKESELIRLAEELAKALSGVRRNDWLRWVQLAGGDLKRGLQLARMMSRDPSLRRGPQEAALKIARVLEEHWNNLQPLSPQERWRVFAWMARILLIHEQTAGRRNEGA